MQESDNPFPSGAKQLGLDLGDKAPSRAYQPDLAEIRQDLEAILDAARGVTAEAPWDERTYRYNKVVFPQMARWLPDDEAAQLCLVFHREIARIETLMAA
ncbi:MAG: hypothetical protein QOG13_1122 [Sphingomonadales bacterium]|jgi:hypothetical protein|nr:hypothetical protein [Sphingomonadales bacterium]MEA3045276.1 hypothetical protein [Sphingomonadales bacterium]